MSTGWHWFVTLGTLVSLAAAMWLLFANRKTSGQETTGHEWDGIKELDNPLPFWWVGLFVASTFFAIVYLAVFGGLGNTPGILGWSSADEHAENTATQQARFAPLYVRLAGMSADELKEDTEGRQVGRRLFINHCSTCHATTAKGSFGFPDLTDDEWIWGGDFETILATVRNGRNAQMPAWGPALGDDGVLEVSHYVLQLAGQPHDEALAGAGKTRFETICVACHGPEGKGNPALGAPNLTNNSWLYGSSIDALGFTIRNGRGGIMPAHEPIIGAEKSHIVAAYVYGLRE